MNHADLATLFTALNGYWPGTAPDIDNAVDVHAYGDLLRAIDLPAALDAARKLAMEGREFCPPAGVLAKEARPVIPPYHVDYVEEAPALTPPSTGRADGTRADGGWTDSEGFQYFPDGSLDVPQLIADMKAKLRGKPGAKFLDPAIRQMYEQSRGKADRKAAEKKARKDAAKK